MPQPIDHEMVRVRGALAVLAIGLCAILSMGCHALAAQVDTRQEEATSPDTGRKTLKLPNGDTLEFVRIEGGNVRIDDRDVHVNSFWVCVSEITWRQFDLYPTTMARLSEAAARADIGHKWIELLKASHSPPIAGPNTWWRGDRVGAAFTRNHPISIATPYSAAQFTNWMRAATGEHCRLPNISEWRLLAERAQTRLMQKIRNDEPNLDKQIEEQLFRIAWALDDPAIEEPFLEGPRRVNLKALDVSGLHDFFGNVGEWVVEKNERNELSSLLLGGSWNDTAGEILSFTGKREDPEWKAGDPEVPKSKWYYTDSEYTTGFRVVISIDGNGERTWDAFLRQLEAKIIDKPVDESELKTVIWGVWNRRGVESNSSAPAQ